MLAAGAGNLGARVSGGAIAVAAISLVRLPVKPPPMARAGGFERSRRRRTSDHPCSHEEGRTTMHGHERPVERKIRLWVSQQEEDRRKERQLGRIEEARDALGERRQRVVDVRAHEERQGS
jgi:hypothetical protein